MSSYLITGATGLVGGRLLETIIRKNAKEKPAIILPVRDERRAKQNLEKYIANIEDVRFVACDVTDMTQERFPSDIDVEYILHCAAPTESAYMASHPVETADSIVLGTKNALELARSFQVKSMVFLSSMEVYGVVPAESNLRKEEDLGYLKLDAPRSSYPVAKRMAEHYCHLYAKEYSVPVKIARLAQVFGRGVRSTDHRVFMQFANSAKTGKNIVLHTDGKSYGNYCSVEDAVEGILTILHYGIDGEAYNVVNEANTMTIREMAELVATKVAAGKIAVQVEKKDFAETGYAPHTGLHMSAEKLRRLGWAPKQDLVSMYKELLSDV